jgi:hypothetical protein
MARHERLIYDPIQNLPRIFPHLTVPGLSTFHVLKCRNLHVDSVLLRRLHNTVLARS